MNSFSSLIGKMVQFFFGRGNEQRDHSMAGGKEATAFTSSTRIRARNFDADYRAATKLLKARMDRRFPDNYQARTSLNASNTYDHGEDRATAVDTASAAIAMALREGATVQQAADAAAASIDI